MNTSKSSSQGHKPTAERAALQAAIVREPQDWQAWLRLIRYETELGAPSRSVQVLMQAQPMHAHRLEFWQMLLLALGRLGDAEAVLPIVESLLAPQWQSTEAYRAMSPEDRVAYQELQPLLASIRILLLFGREDCSNQQLLQELASLEQRWYADILPLSGVYANDPDPERPLRIGLVSNEWLGHVLAITHLPMLRSHDAQAFSFVAYVDNAADNPVDPAVLAELGPFEAIHLSHDWHPYRFYHQVQSDRIDILLDLSGHLNAARLRSLALKPAPIQIVAGINPPFTVGLHCMDYLFSDPILHPDSLNPLYAETHLPLEIFFYWHPPEDAPLSPLPLLSQPGPSFGVIASPNKYSDRSLGLWAAVLADHPQGRLILKDETFQDTGFAEQLRRRFMAASGDPSRLELRDNRLSPSHLPFLAEIDLLLDSSPSPGGLSSCDALWMGVPVLSMANERRLPADIHRALGTSDLLLANDPDDYRRKATHLCSHPALLQELRSTLREKLRQSPICDLPTQIRQREAHYRRIWQDWCRGQRR